MQGQPSGQTPQTPPNRPERVPPPVGPVRKQTQRTNWLPILFGGGIALALVCAVAFVIYSFFFFKPEVKVQEAEATATLEIVKFDTAATPPPAQAANQLPPAQDTASQPEAPANTQPDQQAPQTSEQSTSPPQPETSGSIQLVDDSGQGQAAAKMSSPDFGIQAFLYWRPEVAARDLQLIKDIKFNWVKQQVAWRDIEGAGKGIYDWEKMDRMMEQIDAHGLNIIARVDLQPEWAGGGYPEIGPPDDYQDYVNFLTTLATRYKGRIDAYQIWNEPNLAREWGNRPPNPAEYTELLRRSYEAVKAIDPEAIIISAGLAPTTRYDNVAMPDTIFVQGMYDAGAKPYFDALGVHGAGYKVSPLTDPAVVANDPVLNNNDPSPPDMKRIYAFRHVEDVRQVMVQNGDADKRVVVLEFGWTVDPREDSPYYWHAVSEAEQAQYIIEAYNYARDHWQPWIGVMSLIYMASIDWTEDDEQTYWSIILPEYPDFKARPAYWGLLDYSKQR